MALPSWLLKVPDINLYHPSFSDSNLPGSLKINKSKTCREIFFAYQCRQQQFGRRICSIMRQLLLKKIQISAINRMMFSIKKKWIQLTERPAFEFKRQNFLALQIPVVFHCKQRSIFDGLEELCVLLRRTSYPCRFSDMIQHFPRPVSCF